jgi:hypothetical protein
MQARAANLVLGVGILLLPLLIAEPSRAQIADAELSDNSRNYLNIGQSTATQTDATAFYHLPNFTPENYEVSISADDSGTKLAKLTFKGSAPLLMDAAFAEPQAQPQTPGGNPPNAPSSNQTPPSLQDLGIPPEQTQGNAQQQALLDKRTHMLKIHQRLGLITAVPLIATVATSVGAGGKSTSSTDRNVHMVLGAATVGLYLPTAYYAIRAPRVSGTQARGPIRVHKALAWIHGPGMILTPILGAMAYSQKNNGEKVHGIASAHAPVAIVTAGAYGAALLSVSLKF